MAQGDLGIMVQRDLFVGGDLRRGQREPRRPLLLRLLRFWVQHQRLHGFHVWCLRPETPSRSAGHAQFRANGVQHERLNIFYLKAKAIIRP